MNGLSGKIELKGYFERILSERDKADDERERRMDERFEQRDKALEAAFKAQQEAVAAAFKAATEAVAKAEIAQTLATTSLREESQRWQKDFDGLVRSMATQKEITATKLELGSLRSVVTKMIGGLVVLTFVFPFLTAVIFYLITHR